MSPDPKRVSIPGSKRPAIAGIRVVGTVGADEQIEITLILRSKNPQDALSANQVAQNALPEQRRYLTRAELLELQAADPKDIAKVKAFARSFGLKAVRSRTDRHSLILSGSAASMSAAFGIQLKNYEDPEGYFRGRSGNLTVPAELEGIIEGVFGLDDRPQSRPHFQYYLTAGILTRPPNPARSPRCNWRSSINSRPVWMGAGSALPSSSWVEAIARRT